MPPPRARSSRSLAAGQSPLGEKARRAGGPRAPTIPRPAAPSTGATAAGDGPHPLRDRVREVLQGPPSPVRLDLSQQAAERQQANPRVGPSTVPLDGLKVEPGERDESGVGHADVAAEIADPDPVERGEPRDRLVELRRPDPFDGEGVLGQAADLHQPGQFSSPQPGQSHDHRRVGLDARHVADDPLGPERQRAQRSASGSGSRSVARSAGSIASPRRSDSRSGCGVCVRRPPAGRLVTRLSRPGQTRKDGPSKRRVGPRSRDRIPERGPGRIRLFPREQRPGTFEPVAPLFRETAKNSGRSPHLPRPEWREGTIGRPCSAMAQPRSKRHLGAYWLGGGIIRRMDDGR